MIGPVDLSKRRERKARAAFAQSIRDRRASVDEFFEIIEDLQLNVAVIGRVLTRWARRGHRTVRDSHDLVREFLGARARRAAERERPPTPRGPQLELPFSSGHRRHDSGQRA